VVAGIENKALVALKDCFVFAGNEHQQQNREKQPGFHINKIRRVHYTVNVKKAISNGFHTKYN